MLNNIVVIVVIALILILFIGIIRKNTSPEPNQITPDKSYNNNSNSKKFSKALERLRITFGGGYIGAILTCLIFMIFFSSFTSVVWQLGFLFLMGYLILEIIKKISLKENKKLDKKFYFGLFHILFTVVYLFTANKNDPLWSEVLNSTAIGILPGTIVSIIIILFFYVIEKIYLSITSKKTNNYTNFKVEKELAHYQVKNAQPTNNATDNVVEEDINDNEIYEQIADEMENDIKQKGLWTKAIAEADGNESKAKSIYIKFRFNDLKLKKINEEKLERERKERFDRIKNSK